MTTAQKTIKLYTLTQFDRDKYRITQLRVSVDSYPTSYFPSRNVMFKFQANITQDEYDRPVVGEHYAGIVESYTENLIEAMPHLTKALKKSAELCPGNRDELDTLIVGLRATGFKQAHINDEGKIYQQL